MCAILRLQRGSSARRWAVGGRGRGARGGGEAVMLLSLTCPSCFALRHASTRRCRRRRRFFRGCCWLALVLALLVGGPVGQVTASPNKFEFDMVPSGCLASATGHVKVETTQKGQAEEMDVHVSGLPPNTGFDLFAIQTPGAPFGMSCYQSDLQTNEDGKGHVKGFGRFNPETFIVGNGGAGVPAPTPHDGLDASVNPTTKPIHMYHLGL
jgi:hypothetical protein